MSTHRNAILCRLVSRLEVIRQASDSIVEYWQAEVDRGSGYAAVFHRDTINRHAAVVADIDAELAVIHELADEAWLRERAA